MLSEWGGFAVLVHIPKAVLCGVCRFWFVEWLTGGVGLETWLMINDE